MVGRLTEEGVAGGGGGGGVSVRDGEEVIDTYLLNAGGGAEALFHS